MKRPTAARPVSHVVVVPVKPPARGKSRLSTLPHDERARLARAFALDTVAAALECDSVRAVLAVTDDHRFALELAAAGCDVVPDGVTGDLNETLVQAAHEVARRWPEAGIVALCGDLPALRASELDEALTAAALPGASSVYVADAVGTGTTLYAARRLDDFRPAFGPGSAARHDAGGARALTGAWPSLRQDVDEVGDLGRALVLGVGPHTAAATGR